MARMGRHPRHPPPARPQRRRTRCLRRMAQRGEPVTPTTPLAYAACGGAPDPRGHKYPANVPNWQERATTDPERIRRWWTKNRRTAFARHRRRVGLWALDIDPGHGGDDSLRALEAVHGDRPTPSRAPHRRRRHPPPVRLARRRPTDPQQPVRPGRRRHRRPRPAIRSSSPHHPPQRHPVRGEVEHDPLDGVVSLRPRDGSSTRFAPTCAPPSRGARHALGSATIRCPATGGRRATSWPGRAPAGRVDVPQPPPGPRRRRVRAVDQAR